MSGDAPLVVAITGASGAAYARRLLDVLLQKRREVHLAVSPSGRAVLLEELGLEVDLQRRDAAVFGDSAAAAAAEGRLHWHDHRDMLAPIASGSFLTTGMTICPCSGGTLSGVVTGASDNLIRRAADVHLKERRKLVLVPRETPVSLIHLDNMKRAHEAGAVVLPAAPGWYHGVESLEDLVDFIVARILDQLQVPHDLMRRWGERPVESDDA